jgi:IMP dehydrogenase
MMNLALTYDDIQLVPSYSEVYSRKSISLETQVSRNYKISIPLVASPMDTVCGYEMAMSFMKVGGVGCVHRFMSVEEQTHLVKKIFSARTKCGYSGDSPIMAAVGANGDYLQRATELIGAGIDIILIDVAHGHHRNVRDAIQNIKAISHEVDVIAGNIATREAALDLESWGADGLRVGIGGGSLCTTRIKTGFGVPNVTCLQEIVAVAKVPVMADGGIRSSGDISKALALGASCVMIGSLIAGTEESPGSIIETGQGLYKRYRGAASLETKMTHGQEARNVEGESTIIPYKGGVKYIIEGLLDGVRSSFSYAGANSIKEFNPDIVRITAAGKQEAKPHLLK